MSDQPGKSWTASKTVWFNVASGLVGIGVEGAAIVDLLPEEYQHAARFFVVTVTAIGNVILRVITTEPIK